MKGNIRQIVRMIIRKKTWAIIGKLHKMYRSDPTYSWRKGMQMLQLVLQDEKIAFHEGQFIINTFMPPFPSRAFEQYATGVIDPSQNAFFQQTHAQRRAPISMYLSLTHRCPYDCFHCSAKQRRSSEELTTDQWKQVITDLQSMGVSVIGFTGGEPLLRGDLTDLISFIDDRSSSVVFTSGAGMSVQRAEEMKAAGLFSVGISLDSWDPDEHDSKRGHAGAFTQAVQAIRDCRKAGLYTMIQAMIAPSDVNHQFLNRFFDFARSLDAHEVKILEPIPSGRLSLPQSNLVFWNDSTRKTLISIQNEANQTGRYPKITSFPSTESPLRYGCGAGTQHSYIDSDGSLYPCDFVPLSFGNVAKRPVHELWFQMNQTIGLPKTTCFARQIHKELLDLGRTMPLDCSDSRKICEQNQSHTYPGFYKTLQ